MKIIFIITSFIIFAGCSSSPSRQPTQNIVSSGNTFIYPKDAYKFYFNGRHIIVQAIINDSVETTLLFDTGAQSALFDSTFISLNKDKLGVSIEKVKSQTITPAGVINITSQLSGELKFSALGINVSGNMHIAIADLSETGLNADAIFSAYWFFENNIVLMDLEHQYFRMLSQDTLDSIKDQYSSFPLKGNPVTYFTVLTDVEISTTKNDIKLSGELVLDIGAPGFLYLQTGERALRDTGSVIPVNLPQDLKIIKTKSLSWDPKKTIIRNIISTNHISMLDSLTFKNEEVNILDFRIAPQHIGFLGNEFFRKFQVIFDYRNSLFYLKPNKEYLKLHYPFNLGMKLYRTLDTKSFYVNSLYESYQAAEAGIQLGDTILKINDRPSSEITNDELRSFEHLKSGTILKFEVKRRNEILNYEISIDSIDIEFSTQL